MVDLSISDSEASLVLSALSYFDEEVLPRSVPRDTLYKLVKNIVTTFDHPQGSSSMVASKIAPGEIRTLDLSPDEADYMERALLCAVTLGMAEEEMDSEYWEGFVKEIQHLCALEFRLRDALGPEFFEPSPKDRVVWDGIFGLS
jgi:hypothetical protein